jgi:ketosteroid isomerase-like protein
MSDTTSTKRRRAFATGLCAAVALPVHAAAPQTAYHRRFIDEAFARWAAGGSSFFDDVLHDDVVWTIKGSGPSAGVYRGRRDFLDRAVRPFAARMAVPVRPVTRRVWAEGDDVIVQWDGEGTAGDGRPYRNSYVWIFRMRGRKAGAVDAYLDLPAYDDVLGRVPLTS